jgi:hypothetical protein
MSLEAEYPSAFPGGSQMVSGMPWQEVDRQTATNRERTVRNTWQGISSKKARQTIYGNFKLDIR